MQVLISGTDSAGAVHTYNAAPSLLGTMPPAKSSRSYRLQLAEPLNACAPIRSQKDSSWTAIVALRGNCTYAAKARHAQRAGGLLIVYDTNPGQ